MNRWRFVDKWISVRQKKPENGQIVVAWMSKRQEPVCVCYDRVDDIWNELVDADIYDDREDLISHWMPLPEPPGIK